MMLPPGAAQLAFDPPDRAFSVVVPNLCNAIPGEVHPPPSLQAPRKNVKTFLFPQAFGGWRTDAGNLEFIGWKNGLYLLFGF